MNRRRKRSNQKRGQDEDNSDQNQRKKLEVPEKANTTTNFTDVNDNCLEHIFKHLPLADLINLADTCKRFQKSAQSTFEAKYRENQIQLFPTRLYRKQAKIELFEDIIVIYDFTTCLKLLRHFGVKIPKLFIDYFDVGEDQNYTAASMAASMMDASNYYDHGEGQNYMVALAWHLNEYCSDTLTDIVIDSATDLVTTNWTKPFLNVDSIELWGRRILGDLNAWFPNLRRLLLSRSRMCIKYTLPHLLELKIDGSREHRERITEMLRLNQHLQVLRLSGDDYDIKFMKSVSEYIQSVRLLEINFNTQFVNLHGGSVHFKSVIKFHINLKRYDCLSKIPFTFDQLEEVKLTVNEFNLNDNFKNFIRANPSLEKLIMCFTGNFTIPIEQIKSGIAKISPSIYVEFEG